jgi:hypothetical protein
VDWRVKCRCSRAVPHGSTYLPGRLGLRATSGTWRSCAGESGSVDCKLASLHWRLRLTLSPV